MGAIDSRKRVVKVLKFTSCCKSQERSHKKCENSHTAAISKLVTSAGQSLLGALSSQTSEETASTTVDERVVLLGTGWGVIDLVEIRGIRVI